MNAVAALRLWAYEFSFDRVPNHRGDGPHLFRIEPKPAADWIIATIQVGHLGYIPGMLDPAEQELITEALYEGWVTSAELLEANREAIATVSGWPWWSAGKLIGVLIHEMDLAGGLLTLRGVDLQTLPLGAVLNAINALVLSEAGKEERTRWINELVMPPAEKLQPETWDQDAAEVALEMLMKRGATGLPG